MNNIINEKLHELCKLYNFEYEVYLEKVKTNNQNSNYLVDGSLTQSLNNINNIKHEIISLLLSEITMENNQDEPPINENKFSFDMKF